jgi:hypothetical protein
MYTIGHIKISPAKNTAVVTIKIGKKNIKSSCLLTFSGFLLVNRHGAENNSKRFNGGGTEIKSE